MSTQKDFKRINDFLQFFSEKRDVKVLERGENKIMFAETKVPQAMYENVRNQVRAVGNVEGKVAMGFKSGFKQQIAWYEIFYYKKKSMLAFKYKFISWLL